MGSVLTAFLMNEEVLKSVAELAAAAAALMATIVIPWLSLKAKTWLNFKIEEKHQKVLHEAIMTWAYNSVAKGVSYANDASIDELRAYIDSSVPDAVKALKPTAEVLWKLGNRFLQEIKK